MRDIEPNYAFGQNPLGDGAAWSGCAILVLAPSLLPPSEPWASGAGRIRGNPDPVCLLSPPFPVRLSRNRVADGYRCPTRRRRLGSA